MLPLALAVALAGSALAGPEALRGTAGESFEGQARSPLRLAAPSRVSATSAPDDLLGLLDDADPLVRAEAAKSLKAYALYDSRVERKLRELMESPSQPEPVRREALKSLAWAAQHYDTRDAILELAEGAGESEALRALAYKALFVLAGRDGKVTDVLLRAAERGPEVRRLGALWALSGASGDSNAAYQLRRLTEDRSESAAIRVEAVKALFPQLSLRTEVQWTVRSLADDSGAPEDLREAAILSLVALNHDFSSRHLLEKLSRQAGTPKLRTAAIKALGSFTLELARYFHLSHYQGKFIDALEAE